RREETLEELEVVRAAEVLGTDHDRGLRVPQHVLQLGYGVARIERDDDGTELGRSKQRDDELGPVREVDGDAVAALDAELGQCCSKRRRPGIDLCVGEATVACNEEDTVGVLGGLCLEDAGDRVASETLVERHHASRAAQLGPTVAVRRHTVTPPKIVDFAHGSQTLASRRSLGGQRLSARRATESSTAIVCEPAASVAVAPVWLNRAYRMRAARAFLSEAAALRMSAGASPAGSAVGRPSPCRIARSSAAVPGSVTSAASPISASATIPIATPYPCGTAQAESVSIACATVCPKFRMARTPRSSGSACTTAALISTERRMRCARAVGSRASSAFVLARIQRRYSASAIAPCLSASARPARSSRSGSVRSASGSIATSRGCRKAPTRFLPAGTSTAVLPPIEASIIASSDVGTCTQGSPRM